MRPFLINASRAGDRLAGRRPSALAMSGVGTAACDSSDGDADEDDSAAIVRMYSRSAGVARSYREPKNPTASSASASGAATRTSAAVIGDFGAWSQVAFP